ncbi:hypothetical protein LTR10_020888 [Elasticomyces elasticus]|uniref:HpcH/HpaI aldolase/citrate lyase domain-containing protein n=1 Tax=Exophiala sideris TaxID=1016849 RepID=A0ABR0IZZ1_9EURO|nr:hypothetical protein LTR10_020888 [Elasticomyces elasticus]KAK5023399.1 hypothetical protein LTS07_009274 [Exophiala sideris]KAK5028225.1 hypothetical protein LTR13_009213 [Exophiala sideris]KAK5052883.1 hypothetical protein LTR69_009709 [Exophiala sideris]KAK5178494.1 hypothetical protein LTR44_009119 [Eurotiomycetes sp. CCFEE 6388]
MSSIFVKDGKGPKLGCTLGFGTTLSAQLVARAGYDYVLIDMEHNPVSPREAGNLTRAVAAASGGQCQGLIRVPSHGVEWIKWALDCGASGVVIPMVQSADETEAIIQRAVYPPRGQRSFGPALAPFASIDPSDSVQKYLQRASDIAIIPMIESLNAMNELDAICSVAGITTVFIGPVDLRMSMGLRGPDGGEDSYLQALTQAVRTCKHRNIAIGIFAVDARACSKRAADGFDFVLLPGEATLLASAARAQLEDCTKAIRPLNPEL